MTEPLLSSWFRVMRHRCCRHAERLRQLTVRETCLYWSTGPRRSCPGAPHDAILHRERILAVSIEANASPAWLVRDGFDLLRPSSVASPMQSPSGRWVELFGDRRDEAGVSRHQRIRSPSWPLPLSGERRLAEVPGAAADLLIAALRLTVASGSAMPRRSRRRREEGGCFWLTSVQHIVSVSTRGHVRGDRRAASRGGAAREHLAGLHRHPRSSRQSRSCSPLRTMMLREVLPVRPPQSPYGAWIWRSDRTTSDAAGARHRHVRSSASPPRRSLFHRNRRRIRTCRRRSESRPPRLRRGCSPWTTPG